MAFYSHYYHSARRLPLDRIRLRFPLDPQPDWQLEAVHFPPRIGHGNLYLSTGNGLICAFNEEKKELQWSYQLPASRSKDYQPDLLLSGDAVLTRQNQELFVLDARTGQLRQRLPSGYFHLRPAVFEGESLYCLNVDEDLNVSCLRYDLTSGTQVWSRPIDIVPDFLTLSNDAVLLRSGKSQMTCLHATSGEVLWNVEAKGVADPLLAWQDCVIGILKPDLAAAFDRATGEMRWKQRVEGPGSYCLSGDADGRIHILQKDAYLRLSAETGAVQHMVNIEDALKARGMSMLTSATATENHLLFGDIYQGLVVALEQESGDVVWSYRCAGKIPVLHAPVPGDYGVYMVDNSGHFYGFRPV